MYLGFVVFLEEHQIDGNMAEVGVYRGESAEMIANRWPNNPLHLFDTFCGMPARQTKGIDTSVRAEEGVNADTSVEVVKKRLARFENTIYHPGIFPGSAEPIRDLRFAFVNIDVDLYVSTKDCWEFFYPRMLKGGIIAIYDDYPCAHLPGVKKATDEYLVGKPEGLKKYDTSTVYLVKQ